MTKILILTITKQAKIIHLKRSISITKIAIVKEFYMKVIHLEDRQKVNL